MEENAHQNSRPDKLKLLETLFDRKKIRVLQTFLKYPEREFYLRELAKMSGVPPATTFRIVSLFEKTGIIQSIRISRMKLYKAADSDNTKFLSGFLKEEPLVMEVFVEQASKLQGVEKIILHGKLEKNKANVLIIGENIDSAGIKRISAEILEKYRFKVSFLTLSQEQFDQMTRMGLYSGTKKTLYNGKKKQ